jgi:hypothetical protein
MSSSSHTDGRGVRERSLPGRGEGRSPRPRRTGIVRFTMPLTAGAKLDGHEILGPLGAGGMGEGLRARDSVLKRDVALKVLSSSALTQQDNLHQNVPSDPCFRRQAFEECLDRIGIRFIALSLPSTPLFAATLGGLPLVQRDDMDLVATKRSSLCCGGSLCLES